MRDDIHPEELLVARRPLSDDEQETLRIHFEQCPACALQATLRDDVARALVPTDLDYETGARAVERVLLSAPRPSERWPVRIIGRARGTRTTRAAVGLLILLGTSVAASAVMLGTHGRLWDVEPRTPRASALPRRPPSRARESRQPPVAGNDVELSPVSPASAPPASSDALPIGGPPAPPLPPQGGPAPTLPAPARRSARARQASTPAAPAAGLARPAPPTPPAKAPASPE